MSSPAGVIAVTSLLVVPELEQPLALRERNNLLRRVPPDLGTCKTDLHDVVVCAMKALRFMASENTLFGACAFVSAGGR